MSVDIASITSLLTAASTPSSAISAVAGVVLEGEKIADMELTQRILHQYDDQLHDDINTSVTILSEPDSAARGDQLAAHAAGLFDAAGVPFVGGVAGTGGELVVSVAFVLAALTAAAQLRRNNSILSQLEQSAASGKSAAGVVTPGK